MGWLEWTLEMIPWKTIIKNLKDILFLLTASWSLFSDQEHCWTEGAGCQWTRDTPYLCPQTGGSVRGGGTTPYTQDSGECGNLQWTVVLARVSQ